MRTAGRYELVGEVGAGPTGVVHLARDSATGAVLALKEYRMAGSEPAAKARFLETARDLARRLDHPNVLRVHDVFEVDGTPFVAMRYEERGSLRRVVGALTLDQTLRVIEDVLAGLGAAAQAGVVHGDLKPENLLVSGAGRVRIGDFGAAAALWDETAMATTPDLAVGTLAYAAPEQAMGGHVGPRTDLYSLGCIVHEMLTGHVPFHDSDSPVALLSRRMTEDVPPLGSLDPGVPPAIGDWVDRLLARAADQRFPSPEAAWEALADLLPAVLGPDWSPRTGLPAPSSAEAVPPATAPTTGASAAAAVRCPTCDHENPADTDFCAACGEYLRWEPTDSLPAVTPPVRLESEALPPAAAEEAAMDPEAADAPLAEPSVSPAPDAPADVGPPADAPLAEPAASAPAEVEPPADAPHAGPAESPAASAPAEVEPPPTDWDPEDSEWATVRMPAAPRPEAPVPPEADPGPAAAAPAVTAPQPAAPAPPAPAPPPPGATAPPPPAPPPPRAAAPPPPPPRRPAAAAAPTAPDDAAAAAAAPARRGRGGRLRAAAGALFAGRSRAAEEAAATEAPAAEAPALTGEPQLVRRTPHMTLSAEPPLAPGTVFEVAVHADRGPARQGEEIEEILIRAPAGVRTLDLDVWLVATHHFVITDAPIRRLSLGVDAEQSSEARFRVAVVSPAAPGDEPVLTASFSANGRPCGRVTRVVPVATAARTDTAAPLAAAATAAVLEVDLDARAPDITLEIAAPENDGRRFEVRVETPLLELERRTETWFLPADASELVADAMEHFFDPDAVPAARMSSLRGAGLEFFDAAPVLFKEAYWRLVDAGLRPRNLFVVSDERSIPWELMIPSRHGPRGYEEREPLGVELAVGRWHRHTCVSPRQHVPLASSYVVAPQYEGSSRLVHAAAEVEFVCRHFGGTRIEPANFANLDLALARGGADLLHFVCHGEADEHDQILRLEEPDTLRAQQIRAMPGLAKACREHHPLVFLNACEAGRPVRGLVGASGFARSFIEVDASCIVGTLWSVDDETAHAAAIAFYETLLAEPRTSFAEALRAIRARGYAQPGEDSYAAYCFYGDPTAGLP